LLIFFVPTALVAQQSTRELWNVRLRAAMSGSSYESEPANYKVYSGVALEVAVERRLGSVLAVGVSARTESREVVGPQQPGVDNRLGSLEMLPLAAMLKWFPRGRGNAELQPYLGAGGGLTFTWERSGALDSTDEPLAVYPVIGIGADYAVSSRLFLNLDVNWHPQTTHLNDFLRPAPQVSIDPMTFGIGIGVRF
jgi:outer membrane protein W